MRIEFKGGPIDGCVENPEVHTQLELPELRLFPSPTEPNEAVVIYRKMSDGAIVWYQFHTEAKRDKGGASTEADTPPSS